jgi:hypothetical protein
MKGQISTARHLPKILFSMAVFGFAQLISPALASAEKAKSLQGADAKKILKQWASAEKPGPWAGAVARIGFAQLQALAEEPKVKSLTIESLPTDPQNAEPYSLLNVRVVLDQTCNLLTLEMKLFISSNGTRVSPTILKEVANELICETSPRMGSGN